MFLGLIRYDSMGENIVGLRPKPLLMTPTTIPLLPGNQVTGIMKDTTRMKLTATALMTPYERIMTDTEVLRRKNVMRGERV